jgi:integrase
LKKTDGRWIAQWWDQGSRKKRTLGKISVVTKSQAESELAAILAPINARYASPSALVLFRDFVRNTYLPFYRRKWKRSTAMTNEARVESDLVSVLGEEPLGKLTREELQNFLDEKAANGLSFSTVAHLRWDLRQILRMAMVEGYVVRNPAELLFVPRDAPHGDSRVMTCEEVQKCLASFFDRRGALIVKLALLVGLRPGEIFALRCGRVKEGHAEISERIYRNDLDVPKSRQSVRNAALPEHLYWELERWIADLPNNGPEAWVFPSEKLTTPIAKDNLWRRDIQPILDAIGLGWVNFHVFRRTHATLMREGGADPKLVADNMGHSVDVNQNVYTQTPFQMRKEAVDALATRVSVN